MMTDMIVLCATLALSLFFWMVSLTISAYSGEQLALARAFVLRVALISVLCGKARFPFHVCPPCQREGESFVRNRGGLWICGPVS